MLTALALSSGVSAKERGVCARKVPVDAKFVLKQGECAVVANKLEIRFQEVAEDSRCPSDVRCGSAGRAVGLFAVGRKGGALQEMRLEAIPDQAPAKYLKYEIHFLDLAPHPVSTKRGPPSENAATLSVSKAK